MSAKDKKQQLRTKAEARLKKLPVLGENPNVEDLQFLLHELNVFQVELEMQNQELRAAQVHLEISRDLYADLFEFAPIGYFILDKNGFILNANLTGCSLLGIERAALINKPFSMFIVGDLIKLGLFRNYLKEIFLSKTLQSIEIKLKQSENEYFTARLDTVIIKEEKDSPIQYKMALSDITDQERAKSQMDAVLDALEKERSRIAADLHDSINPLLTISKLNIESFLHPPELSRNKETHKLENAVNMLEQAIKEVKSISVNLVPSILKDFGLVKALDDLCLKINQTNSVIVCLDSHITVLPNPKIELALYRIAQEVLNNALKHAQATRIEVQLIRHKKSILLMINDNGKGFDTSNKAYTTKGLGFQNMISRAKNLNGTIDVDSTIGQGTTVIIELLLADLAH